MSISSAAVPVEAFSSLVDRLRALGFTSNDRKYLVWVDTGAVIDHGGSTSCYGVGSLYADETSDPARNYNNTHGGYTRVDDTCLFTVFNATSAGKVEAHELMHTLGAVQGLFRYNGSTITNGSPNSTLYGHCSDDYDIMCYADGPLTVLRRVCTTSNNEMRFDCNHDDYFSTAIGDNSP